MGTTVRNAVKKKRKKCLDCCRHPLESYRKNPNERECPRYTEDAGTHVGCHFQNLSQLPFNTYFLVNGTSQQTAIQFFDTVLSIHKIGENKNAELCGWGAGYSLGRRAGRFPSNIQKTPILQLTPWGWPLPGSPVGEAPAVCTWPGGRGPGS